MNEKINDEPSVKSSSRKRNIILGLILAAASLGMYASIFWRLSVNPLE
ncbi:hypothetical protein N9L49_01150 [Rhodospirillales bacterium]|nr:hypothetical protein [Rhodospirillales bacterium]